MTFFFSFKSFFLRCIATQAQNVFFLEEKYKLVNLFSRRSADLADAEISCPLKYFSAHIYHLQDCVPLWAAAVQHSLE